MKINDENTLKGAFWFRPNPLIGLYPYKFENLDTHLKRHSEISVSVSSEITNRLISYQCRSFSLQSVPKWIFYELHHQYPLEFLKYLKFPHKISKGIMLVVDPEPREDIDAISSDHQLQINRINRIIKGVDEFPVPLLMLCLRFRDNIMPDADLLGDNFTRPYIQRKYYKMDKLVGITEDIVRFLNT